MKCPKCQHENPEDSTFCGKCATKLGHEAEPSFTKTIETSQEELTSGSRLAGRYQVIEELGRGGMGKVYRAEDTSLSRQVAIKVVPEEFANDPERLARFEREAKLLAVLNHPNIAAIYGIEEFEGKRFLVLELAEGETLRDRLERGPLAVEDALETCKQLAEGLEAAHEKGIIHRDLKPGNIMISPEGKVKILDFGLAKAYSGETSAVDIEKSPTITAEMTKPGIVLGTAAYMSPEQAKGRAVDKRTDIWAFGSILYECLTGKRAFSGATVTETIAAIIKGEPDWESLTAYIPGNVRTVLRRCLEKDPNKRLHDIADARLEIEAPVSISLETALLPRKIALPWLVAAMVGLLIIGGLISQFIVRPRQSTRRLPAVIATIKTEPGLWLDGLRRGLDLQRPSRPAMAIANDGRFIVYSAIPENPTTGIRPQIYLRKLGEMSASPILGTEGGISPFLSPDDRWIGFWGDGKLKKVSVNGGVTVVLCDAESIFGASWSSDDKIVFTFASNKGLFEIPAEGGTPKPLTEPDKTREEYSHRLPHWLPKGKGVLFTVMREYFDSEPRIAALNAKTKEWHYLLEDAADARYVPTGHIVFLRKGILMAAEFNLDKLELIGQPFPVVNNVIQTLYSNNTEYNTLAGQLSISDTGLLVYASGDVPRPLKNTLVWVDHKGNMVPVGSLKADFFSPRLSPDGTKIAYTNRGSEWRVWVYDIRQGTSSLVTDEPKAVYSIWTLDGKRVIFGWWRYGPYNLHWQPWDGSEPIERLLVSEYWQRPAALSPDGNMLVFLESHPDTRNDIYLLDLKTRAVMPLFNSRYGEEYPELAPDGRWIAFSTDQTGRQEVYIRSLSGSGGRIQVSNGGGTEPLWGKNGKQIYFRSGTQVWTADVQIGEDISVGRPQLLFDGPGLLTGVPIRAWDITLDGQRFLMTKQEDRKPEPLTEMILVQNWFEELKRLVPTGK